MPANTQMSSAMPQFTMPPNYTSQVDAARTKEAISVTPSITTPPTSTVFIPRSDPNVVVTTNTVDPSMSVYPSQQIPMYSPQQPPSIPMYSPQQPPTNISQYPSPQSINYPPS